MMNAKIVHPYYGINKEKEKEKETYFSFQVMFRHPTGQTRRRFHLVLQVHNRQRNAVDLFYGVRISSDRHRG